MRIKDILSPESMIMDLQATTKEEAINEMADLEVATGIVNNKEKFVESIWAREKESTTGIGGGIAMPHARNEYINKARVLFAKSEKGVDYDSLDQQPVYLFFMITAPAGADNTHLQALAKLSSLLINPDLVEKLKAAKTADEVIDLFSQAEADKDKEDAEREAKLAAKKEAEAKAASDEKPLIVGVTACINGIAHTYMAEEALIKAGEKRGVEVRIETNGSEGVKHELTADEIKRAKGVIIASDKQVKMARFDGKQLVKHPVVDGINKPDQLIDEILSGKGSVYHAEAGEASESSAASDGSVWSTIYRHLMSGISHMLPFVIGGGILMAISFLVEQYMGGAKSPAFIFLNSAGNLAFAFMVPVLAGYIAESIGDLPALMPGFVGGFMASIANSSLGGSYAVNANAKAASPAGFLGGIAIGFIAGYLILGLKKLFAKLPKNVEGMKPMLLYPIFGLLFVALIMYYIINPVFGALNGVITNFLNGMGTGNLVLLTTILAGMMSIDMGGPFNKAAYVFATGAFTATGHGNLMAAVMAGGMVPPLATAIATAFWPKKFTDDERKAGISNWLLGISFITEGAIPFATADPLHVIGSSVIGAAIAGGLTQLWGVAVPAPHGGLWVSLLATNIWGYIGATIIGAVIAGVILGLWKPAKASK